MMRTVLMIGVVALGFTPVRFAYAQQGGQSDMSSMPNMAPATDMDAMMTECAKMRRDMKPDAPMTADMRKMMADCDAMDKEMMGDKQMMGDKGTTAPAQPYTPPAERSR